MGKEMNYKQNIKQPKIQTDKENKTKVKQQHLFFIHYFILFYREYRKK